MKKRNKLLINCSIALGAAFVAATAVNMVSRPSPIVASERLFTLLLNSSNRLEDNYSKVVTTEGNIIDFGCERIETGDPDTWQVILGGGSVFNSRAIHGLSSITMTFSGDLFVSCGYMDSDNHLRYLERRGLVSGEEYDFDQRFPDYFKLSSDNGAVIDEATIVYSCQNQSAVVEYFCGETLVGYDLVKKGTTLSPFSPYGYAVSGWYSERSLESLWDFEHDVLFQNIELFADYEYAEAVVHFVDRGTEFQAVKTTYLGQVSQPEVDPAPNLGFKFVGWKEPGADSLFDFSLPLQTEELLLESVFDYDFLELPAVVININDGSDLVYGEYKESAVSVLNTQEKWQLHDVAASVKGRGNSTWSFPKKPCRIKFNKKQSLFGSSYKAKSWVLLANYADKSLSRNYVAYELSKQFEGLDFSSVHEFVDLYFNDEYWGVYLLCDQIQVGKGRVDIDEDVNPDGDNGFLIERDARAPSEGVEGQDYFVFNGLTYAIKSPDTESEAFIENKEAEVAYIKDYFQRCWDAIQSADWELANTLIDMDSFADSYIIDELFANNDCGFSSCYFYKPKDGKLFKGPVWDFDIGAGNVNYNLGNEQECPPDSKLYAKGANVWYRALLTKLPDFSTLMVNRFDNYQIIISSVIDQIDPVNPESLYQKAQSAIGRNFEKWSILGSYVWPEPENVYLVDTVVGQFSFLKEWLSSRNQFLRSCYLG